MDGRAFNPHLMKTLPKPAPQPKPHTPADDYSVRAGQEGVYRTPAPGTAGGWPAPPLAGPPHSLQPLNAMYCFVQETAKIAKIRVTPVLKPCCSSDQPVCARGLQEAARR